MNQITKMGLDPPYRMTHYDQTVGAGSKPVLSAYL